MNINWHWRGEKRNQGFFQSCSKACIALLKERNDSVVVYGFVCRGGG